MFVEGVEVGGAGARRWACAEASRNGDGEASTAV